MNLMTEVRRLAGSGQPEAAIRLVEDRAAAEDLDAVFILANWRLWGMHGPTDYEAGHQLLDRAAAAGFVEAIRLKAYLIANGTGTAANFERAVETLTTIRDQDPDAAHQLMLLENMSEAEPQPETLSADPEIRMFRKLLTPQECEHLGRRAAPALRPSLIVDPATGRGVPHPVRRSSGMHFDPSTEDLVVRAINLRIARVTNTPVECGELLHILRYNPGDQYKTHLDAIPAARNQRHLTALVYLNDNYRGGETTFTKLGLTIKGGAGDCLVFRNADDAGRPDQRMFHAGLPVQAGAKWLASRWIRQRQFDPLKPDE
jgi:prolyl 4-hydroxylase